MDDEFKERHQVIICFLAAAVLLILLPFVALYYFIEYLVEYVAERLIKIFK